MPWLGIVAVALACLGWCEYRNGSSIEQRYKALGQKVDQDPAGRTIRVCNRNKRSLVAFSYARDRARRPENSLHSLGGDDCASL